MKSSRILMGSAILAMGSMLAWGAVPAVQPSTAVAVQGRQQRTPAEQAKASTDRLDKAVTLTDDQKPKVEAIYEKAYTDAAAARAAGGDDAMANSRQIMTKAQADIKALLTPDQQAKMPAGRGRRGGGGGGGN
ncbi:MAG TPA: hypothetical protein VN515_00415 [Terriglobales bacterium]|nr:hypothetical protein [Terriglobales bacterium]